MEDALNSVHENHEESGDSEASSSAPVSFTSVGRRPGFVLAVGDYHGTLAAARSLGRDGIPVAVADSTRFNRAGWSRWTSTRLRCPPLSQADAFIDFLLEEGRREPGRVLYPSSDDTGFLFALHADRLARRYRLYQPPLQTVYALLNKRRLFSLCTELGIGCPDTWLPDSPAAVEALARTLRGPVLLKPQTQIQLESRLKGALVEDPRELPARHEAFWRASRYGAEIVAHDPCVRTPMVQRFLAGASGGIYSLAGFIDEAGTHAVRASIKVLQRPRKFGVGVCFEAAEVRPSLLDGLLRLCRRVGYFGAFEAEFVDEEDRSLLIDFNPRFYGEMAFEVARGLPLATLVHAAACGDHATVRRTLERSETAGTDAPTAYRHRWLMALLLAGERIGGAATDAHASRWRTWHARHRGRILDAVCAHDDWRPGAIHLAQETAAALRHPRAFVRSLLP